MNLPFPSTYPEPIAQSLQSAAPSRWRLYVTAALFLCALLPGLYEFRHPAGFGFGHGFEMVAIARDVVANGEFGNPFDPHVTGPTASNPPLYPLFLAALIRVFGEPAFVLVAVLLNIALNAAIAALMPRLSELVFDDWRPGIPAAFLWMWAMRLMPQWDTTAAVFGSVVFCLAAARALDRGRSGLLPGLVAGMVSLLNPATVLILLPWPLRLARARGVPRARAFRYAAVIAAVVAISNLPWIARNYRVWGAPVLRTNFGYTLYTSNNDCARSTLFENAAAGCYQQTHPVGSAAEIRLMQSLGERQFDRLRTADAVRWIRTHPRRFFQLTAARFAEFWFPDSRTDARAAYGIWAITALSLPGVILMFRRRNGALIYFAAAWLLYPLMFYVVVSCDRYRFPLLWTSLLPAGYFLATLLRPAVAPVPKTSAAAAGVGVPAR